MTWATFLTKIGLAQSHSDASRGLQAKEFVYSPVLCWIPTLNGFTAWPQMKITFKPQDEIKFKFDQKDRIFRGKAYPTNGKSRELHLGEFYYETSKPFWLAPWSPKAFIPQEFFHE